MILETLVAASCVYGNDNSCNSGLNGYVKYNKLDEKAQVIEHNIKKKYPQLHMTAIVLGIAVNRKYNVMLYKNVWYEGDFSDTEHPRNRVVFKYSF